VFITQVDEELIKFRKIVVANKRPRRIQIQPEVFLKNGEVEYKDYEASLYGCIDSNVDHLREVEGLLEMIKRNKQFNNLL
jgi:dipeptidyl-peptidase-3